MQESHAQIELDASQTLVALDNAKSVDWLVVDHYDVNSQWESAMRNTVRRILVIDDLADRNHDCDLLLNQNFSTAPDNPYAALVRPGTKVLLGPRYALLRPEFALLRSTQRPRDGVVRRIIICFGGADPHNHTGAALRALHGHTGSIDRVDVVVGPANPHRERIAALCSGIPNAVFHCPASDIADLLARTDLAIGGGGAMCWERACLGVPTVAFGIAENQRKVLEALIEAGCVLGIPEMHTPDVEKMAVWVNNALENPPLLRGLARRSAELTDGLGAERVADAMFPASLHFRRATIDDTELIYRCRMTCCAVYHSTTEKSREAHNAWMGGRRCQPERVLLMPSGGNLRRSASACARLRQ
jgi:UDP-2,4-diacetamido-2,4,6-trideoxy-beta-L-altropyranose hydrolase